MSAGWRLESRPRTHRSMSIGWRIESRPVSGASMDGVSVINTFTPPNRVIRTEPDTSDIYDNYLRCLISNT